MTAADNDTLADWGELRFLAWMRRFVETEGRAGAGRDFEAPMAIGDDAAYLRLLSRDLLVTADALIEGVHFRRDWIAPDDLGAKALVENLSDLAAMGALPTAAFLSLGVPPSTRIDELKRFFRGLRRAGRRYDCLLAGGDLVRAPQWSIALTVLGRPAVKGVVIGRSSAKPGQTLYVTGVPGESAAGLAALERGRGMSPLVRRHLRPTPRLREAEALAGVCRDLAMIDVSDGVANDAGHLARESGVRIEIERHRLPVSPAMKRLGAELNVDPFDWSLFGGEAYELLFSTRLGPRGIRDAFRALKIRTRVAPIGRIASGRAGVVILDRGGKPLDVSDRTFQHFA